MKRRDLIKGLPALLLPLLILDQGTESFIPEEYQGETVMKHFDADDIPPTILTFYLDGVDVSALATSCYAPSLPNFEAEGWCKLLVLSDDGMPFSLEVGAPPVTEIVEGMVWWKMALM